MSSDTYERFVNGSEDYVELLLIFLSRMTELIDENCKNS